MEEEEDIDPRTGLKIKPKSGYFSAVMNHLKCCIGSGIFAIGFSLKNAGMAVGIPLAVVLAIISLHCQHLLLKSGKEVEKFLERKPDLAETGGFVFKYGPEKTQKLEKGMRIFTNFMLVLTQTGILCVYIVFFADSMMRVAEQHHYTEIKIQMWVLMAFPPIVVTASALTNLKLLAYLSLAANALIVLGIIFVCGMIFSDLPKDYTFEWIGDLLHLPMFINITFMAFCAIQVVLPIYIESSVPEKLGTPLGVLNVSTVIEMFLTISVGSLSYLKFGKECKGSVTLNFEESVLSEIVVILVGLAVMLSYSLNIYVIMEALFPLIADKWGPFRYSWLMLFFFKFFYIIFTFVIAWSLPLLGQIVALIGALGNTTLSITLPALFHCVIKWQTSGKLNKTKDIAIIILSVFAIVAGIVAACMDIAKEIEYIYNPTEKPPSGNSTKE